MSWWPSPLETRLGEAQDGTPLAQVGALAYRVLTTCHHLSQTRMTGLGEGSPVAVENATGREHKVMKEQQNALAFRVSTRDANPFPVAGTMPTISVEEIVDSTTGEWRMLQCL